MARVRKYNLLRIMQNFFFSFSFPNFPFFPLLSSFLFFSIVCQGECGYKYSHHDKAYSLLSLSFPSSILLFSCSFSFSYSSLPYLLKRCCCNPKLRSQAQHHDVEVTVEDAFVSDNAVINSPLAMAS